MKKQLKYVFINPNPPELFAEYATKVFAEEIARNLREKHAFLSSGRVRETLEEKKAP